MRKDLAILDTDIARVRHYLPMMATSNARLIKMWERWVMIGNGSSTDGQRWGNDAAKSCKDGHGHGTEGHGYDTGGQGFARVGQR